MRLLALLALAVSSSCSSSTTCQTGACPMGQQCVFIGSAPTPQCLPACDLADGGGCAAGQRCGCGGSCPGCENCIAVCTP